MTDKVFKGEAITIPPFGYDIVDRKYAINPKEGPIVQEIYRLYARDGLPMMAIANKLKELGYTKKEGNPIELLLIK